MATRIVAILTVILALHEGLAPNALLDGTVVGLLLAILGLLYAHLAVDAEDATGFLAVAIAVGAASSASVLGHIPAIGGHLDAIMAPISTVLYAGVVTVLVKKVVARISG